MWEISINVDLDELYWFWASYWWCFYGAIAVSILFFMQRYLHRHKEYYRNHYMSIDPIVVSALWPLVLSVLIILVILTVTLGPACIVWNYLIQFQNPPVEKEKSNV